MSDIEFTTYTKPEAKVKEFTGNEYTEPLSQLIEATDAWIADGNKIGGENQPAITIGINLDERAESTVSNAIQTAARHLHKTARRVARDESGVVKTGLDESGEEILSGILKLTYIVKPQEKARRGKPASAPDATAEPSAKPAKG
ncbi:MAG TPA: hypothetical protein VJP80_01665 [Candidatus Saccharimonadales bacterium]|nr:hypothetical protein [Candidatus Saccharimonadales bacterium]